MNEAWRYRDWVVDSFNRDRPYDEFVRQQIAGDYAPVSDSEQDSVEGLIASGMLVIGEWGSGDADAKKMYTDIVDDQIHVVSQTFMVHNGNRFLKVFVTEDMVGHKFGEFAPTRTFRGHSNKKEDRR